MATSKKAKLNQLRSGYIQGLALTDAARQASVPYATARNWRRKAAQEGDDWDIARNARNLSSAGAEAMANEVLGELATQFLATIEILKASPPEELGAVARADILVRLMDGYSKAISASAKAMPNANRLAVAMDVVKFLSATIAQRAPSLREQFLAIIESAGEDLVREFGSK